MKRPTSASMHLLCPSLLALATILAACSDAQRPGGSGGGGGGGNKDAANSSGQDGGGNTQDAQNGNPDGQGGQDGGFFDATPPRDTGTQGPRDTGSETPADSGAPSFDGGVLSGDPFVPQQAASQFAQAACAFQARCQPAIFAFNGSTQQTCVTDLTARLVAAYTAYEPVIQAGRAAYRQSGLTACVQAYQQASCTDWVATNACANIFEGNRPDGAPCGASIECASGTFCASPIAGCGQCLSYLAPGDACQDANGGLLGLCQPGSDCYQTGQTDFTCVREDVSANQGCGTANTGLCRGALDCVAQPMMAGTCQAPATTVGASCDPQVETAAGCNIYQNLTCGANSTCQTVSWVQAGAQCGQAAPTNGCRSNTRCGQMADGAQANTCIALPGPGQACATQNGLCATGSFCDAQGNCVAELGTGQTCTPNDLCGGNDECVNGSCGALVFNASCN